MGFKKNDYKMCLIMYLIEWCDWQLRQNDPQLVGVTQLLDAPSQQINNNTCFTSN